jgi:imidazole glycerol-phosphate synthase subunit HisF
MLKKRLIPCLLLKNGVLVRSERFRVHQNIGNPIHEVERYNKWAVDELVYLDISETDVYDLGRDDLKVKNCPDPLDILAAVSKTCFMPLTWGGRIRTLEDIRARLRRGADKVTINTQALAAPEFITAAAQTFGSQCIVVSMDVLRHEDGRHEVFTGHGREPTGLDPVIWARRVEASGAGEILLNSIDRDGTGRGYDLDLIRAVASATHIPVIACGGVGRFQHFVEGLAAGASAVSAANIFHFTELSDRQAKKALQQAGIDVRT